MDFPSALHYPLVTINPPSGHLSLNPCRVILPPRDTGGEYGHSSSEESPTSDLLHLTFVFVFFCFVVPGERSSPTTWTKSSSGSLRLASASNRSLSTSPPVKERRSRGSQSFVLLTLNAFRCRTPECKPLNCSPK